MMWHANRGAGRTRLNAEQVHALANVPFSVLGPAAG
jgi:hypothetical protein